MTVEQRVRTALRGVTPQIEATNGIFYSEADEYYVFTISSLGDGYADDAPCAERHLVSVHLFAKLDTDVTARKRATKTALFNSGFTWPRVEDDSDGNGRHLLFSCEDAEGLDL